MYQQRNLEIMFMLKCIIFCQSWTSLVMKKVEYEVPGDIIWNNLISSTRVELQLSRSTIIWIALKIHYQFISRSPSFGPPFIDLPIVGSIFQIYGRPSTMYLNKEKWLYWAITINNIYKSNLGWYSIPFSINSRLS